MIKDSNKRIMVTLTEKELARLEDLARETGLSKSVIIKIALNEKLDKFDNILK